MLVKFIELIKIKLNQSKWWSKASTKFDVLDLIKIINSVIFKFKYQKCLPLFLHQAKTNLYTIHQVNTSNSEYLENFNNLVGMECEFNGQIHYQAIVYIIPGGGGGV